MTEVSPHRVARPPARPRLLGGLGMTAAIASVPASAILFKLAAQQLDHSLSRYLGYFIPGVLIGLLYSLGTTLALRYSDKNPNVVFGAIGGLGAAGCYVGLALYFQYTVSGWEYLGIGLIVCGVVGLQLDSPPTVRVPASDVTERDA